VQKRIEVKMKKVIIVLVICIILFLLWQIHPLILFLLENPEKLGEVFEAFFVTGGIGVFADS
jgi:hypothetical protein